ncbi:acyl-CoA thioesterase [Mycolicibacterium sp.]|uniref:acyl-CoA thioesterase n=1 Tax=Mycolicibacterium sp. TaxID=2320850 RepID=UPI0037C5F4D7
MISERPGFLRSTVQLRYGDIDRQGHVNNSAVLQIVESARTALWDRAALPVSPGQVIRQQTVEYLRPIHADHDPVLVEHWCVKIGRTSYVLEFRVLGCDEDVFCRGSIVMVSVDSVGTPQEIPATLRSILESLSDRPEVTTPVT